MDNTDTSLHARIARVMGAMGTIPKTGTNTHFNYKFVTAEDVAENVRALLAAEGIAFYASIVHRELVPIEKTKTGKNTGEMYIDKTFRWVVDFEFTFAAEEETQVCQWTAEADASDDKGINKCATAAEKYFLLKTFIVSTGDEPDADADADKARSKPTDVLRTPQQRPTQAPQKPASAAASSSAPKSAPAPTGGAVDTFTADAYGISWHDKRDGKGTYYRIHALDVNKADIRITAFDTTALDLLGFDLKALTEKEKVDIGYEVRVPYLLDAKDDGTQFKSLDAEKVLLSTQYTAVPT